MDRRKARLEHQRKGRGRRGIARLVPPEHGIPGKDNRRMRAADALGSVCEGSPMKPSRFDSPWFAIPFVLYGFILWIFATCLVPN